MLADGIGKGGVCVSAKDLQPVVQRRPSLGMNAWTITSALPALSGGLWQRTAPPLVFPAVHSISPTPGRLKVARSVVPAHTSGHAETSMRPHVPNRGCIGYTKNRYENDLSWNPVS